MESAYSYYLCRLCLRRDDCFVNIFTSNNVYGYVAAKVIAEVLHYQVSEEDSYPKVVCMTCLGKLIEFKIFKEQCDKSIETYYTDFCLAEDLRHPQQKVVERSQCSHLDTPSNVKTEMEEVKEETEEEFAIKDEPSDSAEDGNFAIKAEIEGTYHEEVVLQEPVKYLSHPIFSSTSKETKKAEHLTMKISRRKSVKILHKPVEPKHKPVEPKEKKASSLSIQQVDVMTTSSGNDDAALHVTSQMESDDDSEGIGGIMPVETELRSATDAEDNEDFLSEDFEEVDDKNDADYEIGSEKKKRPSRRSKRSSLFQNLWCTNEDFPFKCDHCGKSFKNKLGLTDHKRVHFKDKPYGCKMCEERFATKEEANGHRMNSHVQEKNHVCQVCDKRFADEYQLRKHGVVHSEERPFPCEYCGKCFKTKPVLEDHLRIHRNEKPFVCNICDKSFNQRANLRAHIASHNNIKPHKCEYCEKTFSRRHHLMDHVRSHTKERPYVCEICGKTFGLRNKWRLHMLSVHATGKDFRCEICGKSFACTKYLKRHSATHNNK